MSQPPESVERSRRWLAVLIVAVVAVAAAGAAAFALVGSDDTNPRISARDAVETEQLRAECEQWASRDGAGAGDAASSSWCGHMIGWMYGQMEAGHRPGSRMWGNPRGVREACLDAMRDYESVDDPSTQCEAMVDWIAEGRGDWDHGVMNPSGMGR
jgi:hypothetical protein